METAKEIVIWEQNPVLVKTLKQTVFPNANGEELALYFHQCRRTGVHPLDGLIHPVKRGTGGDSRVSFQASIDYLRSVADESGEYGGQDEPEYEGLVEDKYPELARVNVYRQGIDRPFVGVARWSEYYPGEKLGFMWRKMPHNQLAKCAEALALRKAFPQKLHGLYIGEEMDQANVPDVKEEEETKTKVVRKSTTKAEGQGSGKTPHQALNDELEAYCGGDRALRAQTLKDISLFLNDKKEEVFMRNIPSEGKNDKWVGSALGKLRKLAEGKPQEAGGLMDEVTPDNIRDIFTQAGYAEDQILSKIGTILQGPPKKAIEDYSDRALKDVAAWMGENEQC